MELKQEMIDKYNALPVWAKKELSYCDMGWEYTGNAIMGWDYIVRPGLFLPQTSLYGKTSANTSYVLDPDNSFEFEENSSYRIPSSVTFYSKRIRDLLCNENEDLEVDAELNGDNIEFSAFINFNNERIKITGVGENSLHSAFDLFVKSVSFYEENYIPSLSNLEGITDTFEDRNGECSVELKNISCVSKVYDEHKRFCECIVDISTTKLNYSKIEIFYFKLKTIEGIINVYTDYNISNLLSLGTQDILCQDSLFPYSTQAAKSTWSGNSNYKITCMNSDTSYNDAISGGYSITGDGNIGTISNIGNAIRGYLEHKDKTGKTNWKKKKLS